MQNKHQLALALGVLIFASSTIVFGVVLLIENPKDWPIVQDKDYSNWVTLVVEIGVGIIIASVIFIITRFQQKEIQSILRRQDSISKMQEVRLIRIIVGRIRMSIFVLERMQFEIEQRKTRVYDLNSNERMIQLRNDVRKLVEIWEELDLSVLFSDNIINQTKNTIIHLNSDVNFWDADYDIPESDIFQTLGDLLDSLNSYVTNLMPSNST